MKFMNYFMKFMNYFSNCNCFQICKGICKFPALFNSFTCTVDFGSLWQILSYFSLTVECINVRIRKICSVSKNSRYDDFRKLYRFDREDVQSSGNYFLNDAGKRRSAALTPTNTTIVFLLKLSDPDIQNYVYLNN